MLKMKHLLYILLILIGVTACKSTPTEGEGQKI